MGFISFICLLSAGFHLAQGAETVTAYGNPNCNGGATGHETVLNGDDACDENLRDSFSLTVDQIDDGCYVETYTSGNCGAGQALLADMKLEIEAIPKAPTLVCKLQQMNLLCLH